MGTRFRKSKKILPGVTLNLNKKSASISIGPKGFRQTFSTTGKKTTTVGLPGTGLSYTQTSGSKQQTAPVELEPSPKNKTAALILAILTGYIGFHRFYVGKVGTGILYLLTGGMFLFGWIIDICKIAGNKFTDGKGRLITGRRA